MATVTTSIGDNTSITTATPSSCSGSNPYSVDFGSAPSDVNVGDIYVATDQSTHFGTYTYLVESVSGSTLGLRYITDDLGFSGGAASPCDLVDFSYNPVTGTFKRAYSSITAWEADLDNTDFYSSSDDAVGECHKDGTHTFNESLTINGGGTVGLSSVKLTTHNSSGNRHDGTATSGAKVRYTGSNTTTLTIDRNDVTVEFLEFDMSAGQNANNRALTISSNAYDNTIIRSNLIYDLIGSFPQAVRFEAGNSASDTRYFHNNIIYDVNDSDDQVIGVILIGNYPLNVWNNTTYLIRTGRASKNAWSFYAQNASAGMVVKNNLGIMTASTGTELFSANYDSSSDYNGSDFATATAGTNDLTSLTTSEFVSVTPGAEDLHLASGASAIDAGVDLGTTAGVNIDIDGETRGTWSIGADRPEPTAIIVEPDEISAVIKTIDPTVEIISPVEPPAISAVISTVAPTIEIISPVEPPAISTVISTANAVATQDSVTVNGGTISTVISTANATAAQASLTVEPSAISAVIKTMTPTVVMGSTTVNGGIINTAIDTVNPTISTSLTLSPVISVVISTVNPTIGGGIGVTPNAEVKAVVKTVAPTVVLGSISVTPPVVILSLDTVAPTIATDSVTVTTPVISTIVDLTTPDVVQDSQTLTVDPISTVVSTQNPTISITTTNVIVSAGTISAVVKTVAPTVSQDSHSVTPPRITAKVDTLQPTVIQDSVAVTPAALNAVVDSVNTSVSMGSISVTPAVRTIVIKTMAPALTLGDVTVSTLPIIAGFSTVAPSIVMPPLDVFPAAISAAIDVVDPTTSQDNVTVEPTISAVAKTLNPTIAISSVTVTPAAISTVVSSPDVVLIVPPFFTIEPRAIGLVISTVNPTITINDQLAEGLEYTLSTNRLDFTPSTNRVQFTLPENRLDFTLKD